MKKWCNTTWIHRTTNQLFLEKKYHWYLDKVVISLINLKLMMHSCNKYKKYFEGWEWDRKPPFTVPKKIYSYFLSNISIKLDKNRVWNFSVFFLQLLHQLTQAITHAAIHLWKSMLLPDICLDFKSAKEDTYLSTALFSTFPSFSKIQ